jgi:hypothetical protein
MVCLGFMNVYNAIPHQAAGLGEISISMTGMMKHMKQPLGQEHT